MERLRSSDRVRGILNSKSSDARQKYKFSLTASQIDSDIVPRTAHRTDTDSNDSFDKVSKKRMTRAMPQNSAIKYTTTFNEAILESVWKSSSSPFISHYSQNAKGDTAYVTHFVATQVKPESEPAHFLCSVCSFPAPYTCTACGMRFCSIKCHTIHKETRCLKHVR